MKVFNKKELFDMDLPWSAVEDKIVGNSRWSIEHEIVFELNGKYYKTRYSVGATERQDEMPWQYEKEIECIEVEKREIKVMDWVEV